MNLFIGIGNLCKDIELKYTANNKEVVSNSIAIKNDYKNKDGKYDTTFINFVAYGSTAKFLSQYAKKGNKISVEGNINTYTYEDKDGKTEYGFRILANKVELLTNVSKNVDNSEQVSEQVNRETNQDLTEELPF